MEKDKDKGKEPEALPDESLDEAAGGVTAASFPGFGGAVSQTGITDGTSKTGFLGGVRVASGDVNTDGTALKIADGSVKPGT